MRKRVALCLFVGLALSGFALVYYRMLHRVKTDCGVDDSWSRAELPKTQIAILLGLLRTTYPPSSDSKEYWFSHSDGRVCYCREYGNAFYIVKFAQDNGAWMVEPERVGRTPGG